MVTVSHFHTLLPTIVPTLQKEKVILRLSEHGDVIIERQSVWLLIYHFGTFRNSVCLLLVKRMWQPCHWISLAATLA